MEPESSSPYPQVPQLRTRANFSELYFQQDGATPYNALLVRNYLDKISPLHWIGRRGSIVWPSRSPDLTPMDFFLWGVMKNKVYDRKRQTVDQMKIWTHLWTLIQTASCVELCVKVFRIGWMHVVTLMENITRT